jgi:hypothetical protein
VAATNVGVNANFYHHIRKRISFKKPVQFFSNSGLSNSVAKNLPFFIWASDTPAGLTMATCQKAYYRMTYVDV